MTINKWIEAIFDTRENGISIIQPKNFSITFGYKMSFEAINSTIRSNFDSKHPPATINKFLIR